MSRHGKSKGKSRSDKPLSAKVKESRPEKSVVATEATGALPREDIVRQEPAPPPVRAKAPVAPEPEPTPPPAVAKTPVAPKPEPKPTAVRAKAPVAPKPEPTPAPVPAKAAVAPKPEPTPAPVRAEAPVAPKPEPTPPPVRAKAPAAPKPEPTPPVRAKAAVIAEPKVQPGSPPAESAVDTLQRSFYVARLGTVEVHRLLFDIGRRNVASGLDFAKSLAAAKTPVEAVRLQFAFFDERMKTLLRQAEELRSLSADLVAQANEPLREHLRWKGITAWWR